MLKLGQQITVTHLLLFNKRGHYVKTFLTILLIVVILFGAISAIIFFASIRINHTTGEEEMYDGRTYDGS